MTRWNTPEAYQPRQFVHPNVDAVIDEIRAIRREQDMEKQEPSGVVFVGFTYAVTFALGVGLLAGPALLGCVLGASAVGLLSWTIWRESRRD